MEKDIKDVLKQYGKLYVFCFEKNRYGKNILFHQSTYTNVERWNKGFVELKNGNSMFPSSSAIVRNPQKIQTSAINKSEDEIILLYDDAAVRMIGRRKCL